MHDRDAELHREMEMQKSLYDAIVEKLKHKIATMVGDKCECMACVADAVGGRAMPCR